MEVIRDPLLAVREQLATSVAPNIQHASIEINIERPDHPWKTWSLPVLTKAM